MKAKQILTNHLDKILILGVITAGICFFTFQTVDSNVPVNQDIVQKYESLDGKTKITVYYNEKNKFNYIIEGPNIYNFAHDIDPAKFPARMSNILDGFKRIEDVEFICVYNML